MSRFLREELQALKGYTPGEQPRDKKYIKLNTNESPYPPGQKVIEALDGSRMEDLRLYSDPVQLELRDAIAKLYSREAGMNLDAENVFCSNGSDDIINFAFSAFGGRRGRVIYPEISYGFYRVFSDFYGAESREVPMLEGLKVDLDAFCERGYALKIIANPNAPTGEAFGRDAIERILESDMDAVVLIDEAYVDFGGETALPLLSKYENLLVSRTFSKSWSLAGARLGYAFGGRELISDLELIKYSTNPYSINRMSQLVGLAALSEVEYYRNNCKAIVETRERVFGELEGLGLEVLPSKANFIFVRTAPLISGEEAYLKLKERGILVRWFDKDEIRDYLRITIGLPEEMERLIREIEELIKEK